MKKDNTVFSLPLDGAIYTRRIFERCKELVSYGVWSGLEQPRLDAWIGNFKTDEERYFAACVLDSAIYRSAPQTRSLMKQLFQRTVPDLARNNNLSNRLLTCFAGLRSATDPKIRVIPIIPDDEVAIKSGSHIGRELRRHLEFSWFASPEEAADYVDEGYDVIFVDDFLGTGFQFCDFVEDSRLESAIETGSCLYVPLAGHTEGIKHVHDTYPKLSIDAVEILDKEQALFHPSAGIFPDSCNSPESARKFYYDILSQNQISRGGPNRRGFGKFELVYAFEHGCPDNSLPILWWEESPSWTYLFKR